ncbi:DUF2142 domain-containing protein [Cryobacterium melibiosiphilum]|uniref:DUF2142 domain-containing protein n=1 Tax=Cryobacterium melibiosiphilum TaxID=995039 RepID=A0A3A5ML32_9MICO|nr:DUF2142 domain-containing protein [Cryobacterium melibiosiphilum]RJT87808.1 DUF2142 domain-containing protein [Cryobacterium melibiosiphilum]
MTAAAAAVVKPRATGGTTGLARTTKVFWAAFALMALLTTMWSLASPIFSVPDENAHATKAIAQVRGQVLGYQVEGVKHTVVDLPPEYSYSQTIVCYLFAPEIPANCGFELGGDGGADWFPTWVSAYNPLYYYAVGWPSLILDGSAGIYGMRIISGLLCAAFAGLAFQVAMSVRRSRWMPLGLAFVFTPMITYFFGSVNPNGLEIASAAALWVSLLRLLQHFDGRDAGTVSSLSRRYLWFVVSISSIVLVTARSLGPLWLVLVVLLCFLACGWHPVKRLFTTPASYVGLAFIAAGGIFSIVWTLSGGSLSGQAEASDAPLVGATFLQGFAHTLRTTPDYLLQAIGFFGWLDTPLPVHVYWLFVAAFGLLALLAVATAGRRSLVTLAGIIGAAIFVPALVQGYSVGQTGIIWQGRYGLFLYVGVAIFAAWVLSGRDGRRVAYLAPRVTALAGSLLAVYAAFAFLLVLKRYVVGRGHPISLMFSDPTWQPPLGWIALASVFVLTTAAFAVWCVRLSVTPVEDDTTGVVDARAVSSGRAGSVPAASEAQAERLAPRELTHG